MCVVRHMLLRVIWNVAFVCGIRFWIWPGEKSNKVELHNLKFPCRSMPFFSRFVPVLQKYHFLHTVVRNTKTGIQNGRYHPYQFFVRRCLNKNKDIALKVRMFVGRL